MVKLKELKEALQSNDLVLIEELYERIYNDYYKLVYYIIIKIVKDTEDCIEIVNDVFLKAFNNIEKFNIYDNKSSIKSWIVRIAKNEAINFYNKQKRNNTLLDDEYISNTISPSIDKFLLLIDEFKEFLTEEELDILMFRIYYDMKLREIAEYYESTTSIIYTKYQNALKKLKDYYKKGDFHE